MGTASSTQSKVKIAASARRPAANDPDELPDLMPDVESVMLPGMFEVPESWKQLGARLRSKVVRIARRH